MKHLKLKALFVLTIMSISMAKPAFADPVSSDPANPASSDSANLLRSFTLEGKDYTLPFDYTDLEKDGWTPSWDVDTELDGHTYTRLSLEKEIQGTTAFFDICVFNGTGNAKKIRDCQVCSVMVTKRNLDMYKYSFALSNGIKPGDDIATVLSIMGNPDRSTEFDYCTIGVYGDRNNGGSIQFDWYKDEGEKDSNCITMECFQTTETETSDTYPEYLNDYKAPDTMSSDLNDTMVTIDNVIFKLPCPVKVFEENGWVLKNNNPVIAGGFELNTLTKGSVRLEITAENFADYQTSTENCAVTGITAYYTPNITPLPDLTLSNNISFNSTKEELDASAVFEKDEQNHFIIYTYAFIDARIFCQVTYDTETNCITSIKLERRTWPEKQ